MKKLFRIFMMGAFMFTFFTNSFSQTTVVSPSSDQTKLTAEQRAAKLVDEMKTATTLSDDQVSKITPFVVEFYKQKDLDIAQNKGNKDALEKARNTRKTTLNNNLKTILTDDQYTKIKNYFENKKKSGDDRLK